MKKYDYIGLNMFESEGLIEIPDFKFISSYYEVWKGGQCIESSECDVTMEVGSLPNRYILVKLTDNPLEILPNHFLFNGRSFSKDRVLLNKGIINPQVEVHNSPEYMSIFAYQQTMDMISFSFDDPQILIEFHK